MPYNDKEHKVSNVNYLNKDFSAFKNTLMEYAKTYFPNTYRDFNETSPGMMLIEMGAYVGDVLSFYIDQQYKEMMLPLAEERRNIINIANMLGYKVKPITPAYVDLTFTCLVDADSTDANNIVPKFDEAFAIDKGAKISSTTDSNVIFETLDIVDFTTSSSIAPEQNSFNSNGIVDDYKLTRKVKAVSGETKTIEFTVGVPQKFLKLTLSETNVIDIIKVTDSNGNVWHETDFLVQDRVPIETHYDNSESGRDNAYDDGTNILTVPVPYTLQYKQTSKRFITEINEDDTTSLIFGNGVLRSGQTLGSDFLQLDQVGITIPGEIEDFDSTQDPFTGDLQSTLGETPAHTTLTVHYRVGGGISSNVPSGDLITIDSSADIVGTSSGKSLSVTNEYPARGGSAGESVDEIRMKSKAFFTTQNRCVTQEDYEARVMAMPAKFGNIAKVFADRSDLQSIFETADINGDDQLTLSEFQSIYGQGSLDQVPGIDLYVLSYDNNKNLVTLPSTGNVTHPIKTNLKNYLSNYRIITDEISIKDGKVINFGVVFDVVAYKSSNKAEVKLRCIDKIKEYFNIDKMQFHQPIYTGDLEYELMGLDGVKSVNYVQLTQDFNNVIGLNGTDLLWDYNKDFPDGADGESHSGQYGWEYNFSFFYGDNAITEVNGVVLPSVTPSVFELKNPRENVKGIVR